MEPKTIGRLICPMPEDPQRGTLGESGNRGEIGLKKAGSEKMNPKVTLRISFREALKSVQGSLSDVGFMLIRLNKRE